MCASECSQCVHVCYVIITVIIIVVTVELWNKWNYIKKHTKKNGTQKSISQNLLIKILWYLAEFLLLSYFI